MTGVSGLWVMLLVVGLLVAQQPGTGVRDWSLEMPNWPDLNGLFYSDIPERGEGLSIFHTPRWQPGWVRSDNTRPQATALKLAYRLENDRVRLEAFVVLGPFDHNDTPRSLEGVPQESAGVLLLRLGETATLTGLAKYGLDPLPVRLVINKPPVPIVPQIINDTTAIRVEGVDQNRAFYKLSLRNLSPKNITGLLLSMASNGGSSSQSEIGTSKHPVIAAGDLHQMMLGLSAPDAAPVMPIIIAAATFDDGSFEGSGEIAAGMEAQRLGATVQERRVSALVQAILDRGDRDDAGMISAIRSQLNALSEEVEPLMIDAVMARHPDLQSAAKASIRSSVLTGMRSGKESLQHALKELERNSLPPGMSLRTWWEMQSAVFEDR